MYQICHLSTYFWLLIFWRTIVKLICGKSGFVHGLLFYLYRIFVTALNYWWRISFDCLLKNIFLPPSLKSSLSAITQTAIRQERIRSTWQVLQGVGNSISKFLQTNPFMQYEEMKGEKPRLHIVVFYNNSISNIYKYPHPPQIYSLGVLCIYL